MDVSETANLFVSNSLICEKYENSKTITNEKEKKQGTITGWL